MLDLMLCAGFDAAHRLCNRAVSFFFGVNPLTAVRYRPQMAPCVCRVAAADGAQIAKRWDADTPAD
jgi:hypothetical protein